MLLLCSLNIKLQIHLSLLVLDLAQMSSSDLQGVSFTASIVCDVRDAAQTVCCVKAPLAGIDHMCVNAEIGGERWTSVFTGAKCVRIQI